MTGQKIDGIEVSNVVKDILKNAVEKLKSEGIEPCLATVLVGDDPASTTYVKNYWATYQQMGNAPSTVYFRLGGFLIIS